MSISDNTSYEQYNVMFFHIMFSSAIPLEAGALTFVKKNTQAFFYLLSAVLVLVLQGQSSPTE